MTTKNTQKLENLEDLWKYKKFLDKVTPKEYLEEQEIKRSEFKIAKKIPLSSICIIILFNNHLIEKKNIEIGSYDDSSVIDKI